MAQGKPRYEDFSQSLTSHNKPIDYTCCVAIVNFPTQQRVVFQSSVDSTDKEHAEIKILESCPTVDIDRVTLFTNKSPCVHCSVALQDFVRCHEFVSMEVIAAAPYNVNRPSCNMPGICSAQHPVNEATCANNARGLTVFNNPSNPQLKLRAFTSQDWVKLANVLDISTSPFDIQSYCTRPEIAENGRSRAEEDALTQIDFNYLTKGLALDLMGETETVKPRKQQIYEAFFNRSSQHAHHISGITYCIAAIQTPEQTNPHVYRYFKCSWASPGQHVEIQAIQFLKEKYSECEVNVTFYMNRSPCHNCSSALQSFLRIRNKRADTSHVTLEIVAATTYHVHRPSCKLPGLCQHEHSTANESEYSKNAKALTPFGGSPNMRLKAFTQYDWVSLASILNALFYEPGVEQCHFDPRAYISKPTDAPFGSRSRAEEDVFTSIDLDLLMHSKDINLVDFTS